MRVNVQYDCSTKPPDVNSYKELVFGMLFEMRNKAELSRVQLETYAALDQRDKIEETYKRYISDMWPVYTEMEKEAGVDAADALREWIGQGTQVVKPMIATLPGRRKYELPKLDRSEFKDIHGKTWPGLQPGKRRRTGIRSLPPGR